MLRATVTDLTLLVLTVKFLRKNSRRDSEQKSEKESKLLGGMKQVEPIHSKSRIKINQ